MEPITKSDILLIKRLSSLTYTSNTLLSKASSQEREDLRDLKRRLGLISEYFAKKYESDYGPLQASVVSGNDISIGGSRLKRIWSGIHKGADNKQYAVQISFVVNHKENCLDVGFYFGRAQGHSKNHEEQQLLKSQQHQLAFSLSNAINENAHFKEKYLKLFELGFISYSNDVYTSPENWANVIISSPSTASIICKVEFDSFGRIDIPKIDFYVSQIIFMMKGIYHIDETTPIGPLTLEQRAKQAERLSEIGTKGELFVFEMEKERLKNIKIEKKVYPDHVALKSDAYGYDILSLDEQKEDIYIEVKTTTRRKDDPYSRNFFISSFELDVYNKNKKSYRLYRVYDIENAPSFEIIDMEKLSKTADGYICSY